MDKIKLNLLPPEIKEQAKKASKQALVNKISIGLLGVLVLGTSSILAIVIFQAASLNNLNSDIEKEKGRIGQLRENEAVVRLLKNRIDTVNLFDKKSYKQAQVYDLITKLLPQGINVSILKIVNNPKVVLQAETNNTVALQNLMDNLADPKKTEGKITLVTVESLSKNLNGRISFELSINLEKGVI